MVPRSTRFLLAGPFWRPFLGSTDASGTILASTMWPPFFRGRSPALRFLAGGRFFFSVLASVPGSGPLFQNVFTCVENSARPQAVLALREGFSAALSDRIKMCMCGL